MTRKEAAQLLWRVAYDKYGMDDNPMRQREAADIVVAALRGWVRTADRLPTREDANKDMRVLAKVAKDGTVKEVRFEKLSWIEWGGAYYFSHWMKLPEVEG